MAWAWVSPVVASVSTGTVGVVGIWLTWLSGKQGRDHAETIAGQKLAHERLLAKEERRQQRLENAYIEFLDKSERVGHWAQISYPLFDSNPPAPVPPLPTLEEQARVDALVKAFGSDEVLTLAETWRSIVLKMIKCDRLIKMGLEHEIERSPRVDFAELQPQEREAREAIADQVAAELGHRNRTQPS
jgi:hypothetical protein